MAINQPLLDKIKADAVKQLTSENINSTNLHIDEKIFSPGDIIQSGKIQISIEKETVMVFADDDPLRNWGHPCRYLLYDANSGELYNTVDSRFTPYLIDPPQSFKVFHQPVSFAPEAELPIPDLKKTSDTPLPNRYALLYSGASEKRHVNDLEFLYRSLISFNYAPENIYVLNYDGTTKYSSPYEPTNIWPVDNTPYKMKVNASGTKSELNNVLDELKSRLKPQDFLLLHTNNHGDGPTEQQSNKESSLITYSNPGTIVDYSAPEFVDKLSELPKFAQMIVVMEQCHSGGFGDLIIKNGPANEIACVSACNGLETSMGGKNFNPFMKAVIFRELHSCAKSNVNYNQSIIKANPETFLKTDDDSTGSNRDNPEFKYNSSYSFFMHFYS